MPSEVTKYQESACKFLIRIFGEDNVKKEWSVTKDSQDGYARGLYAPRLDIAVGPFNINGRIEENNAAIIRTLDDNKDIIERLIESAECSIPTFRELRSNRNKNPRCFLAIEIEKSGSRKHMLGNIANTSIIGALGIVVPFDDKALIAYKRICDYINFAAEVGKTRGIFKNVLIIKNQAFIHCLEDNPS
jgi:hypothetical protein